MTTQRKGFTLVELSIVLIIIGLIIGGVLKGTDLINSAKTKKMYNTWIKGWQISINSYQDRTGNVLADGGPAAPINNGGSANTSDGLFDNINLSNTLTVQGRLVAVGIDVPVTNTGGSATVSPAGGSYRLEGKDRTGLSVMTLANRNFSGSNRNVIEINNVPNDIAMAIDTMIDGTANAGLGDCRSSTASAGGTTVAWPASTAALSIVRIAI
jgi:prepilin-type N-terminal cleavage/methylation domain-containing protein